MSVPSFADYVAPTIEDSDAYRAADNIGHVCIINVRKYEQSIITPNSPDGAPGVAVDVVDLDAPGGPAAQVFRNVLMMTGAIVDGFKVHAGTGKPLVVSWEKRTAKSGRTYPAPASSTTADLTRAAAWYAANGDPFAPAFDTVAAGDSDLNPPF